MNSFEFILNREIDAVLVCLLLTLNRCQPIFIFCIDVFDFFVIHVHGAQSEFTCSKLPKETLEPGSKYVQS